MVELYVKVVNITCRVYPGSHWKDTTLFIWRRSPTLIPFIGTTGSGQLVRDTAKDEKNREKKCYKVAIKITIQKQELHDKNIAGKTSDTGVHCS